MTLGAISRRTFLFLTPVTLFFLSGCGTKRPGVEYLAVLDITASVDPLAESGMFAAVTALAQQLRRGDSLTIILVTGDVQAEASGRVLHYEAGKPREVYDADLKNLADRIHADLDAEKQAALAHPATHTDLLGAIDLAAEQGAALLGTRRCVLLVLSDFLQDDQEFNFERVKELGDAPKAGRFAEKLAHAHERRFPVGTVAYLGLLRSSDYASLAKVRRQGLEVFWLRYLTLLGVQPTFATDGPGLLASFLNHVEGASPASK